MRGQSIAKGVSESGPDMRTGSPVHPAFRSLAYLDARAVTTTFWDLL